MRIGALRNDDSYLLTSNVDENLFDGAAVDTWTVGGSWDTGDLVVYKEPIVDTVYMSTEDANSGNDPLANPTKWTEMGSSDRWAMFDNYVDTLTEQDDSIEVVIDTSNSNSLLVMGAYGAELTVSVSDGSVYYTETVDLLHANAIDFYGVLFGPYRIGRDLVFYFESKGSSTATVTITHTGYTAKCGMCFPCVAYDLGWTRYGVKVGITDYSIVKANDFGNYYLYQGSWAKRCSATIRIADGEADEVFRLVKAQTGKASFYDFNQYPYAIADGHSSIDNFQSFLLYGFVEPFVTTVHSLNYYTGDFTVQGLT